MGNFGFVLTPIDSNESPYRFYIWRKLIAAIDRSSSGIQNRWPYGFRSAWSVHCFWV